MGQSRHRGGKETDGVKKLLQKRGMASLGEIKVRPELCVGREAAVLPEPGRRKEEN